eukprot:TRINITY_DN26736_c0_g1_i1.p1 TRINITY_DN26736_c0_g1~~TRINITY_DN26736_c0_g1_i1.p1  ORF type:complete len:516 (-),score=84.66 TRINITY_DN26736_c0_g1_i1:41-1363(-)
MVERRVEPTLCSFNAVISACDKGHFWEKALCLLLSAGKQECGPDVITFNASIGACSRGRQWERALELLLLMMDLRVCPTVTSFNTCMIAWEEGERWAEALSMLSGDGPVVAEELDLLACRAALGSLERSGQVRLGARAAQLMHMSVFIELGGLGGELTSRSVTSSRNSQGRVITSVASRSRTDGNGILDAVAVSSDLLSGHGGLHEVVRRMFCRRIVAPVCSKLGSLAACTGVTSVSSRGLFGGWQQRLHDSQLERRGACGGFFTREVLQERGLGALGEEEGEAEEKPAMMMEKVGKTETMMKKTLMMEKMENVDKMEKMEMKESEEKEAGDEKGRVEKRRAKSAPIGASALAASVHATLAFAQIEAAEAGVPETSPCQPSARRLAATAGFDLELAPPSLRRPGQGVSLRRAHGTATDCRLRGSELCWRGLPLGISVSAL